MSEQRKQSLFIIVYPREDTADEVYQTLRRLEKQDKIDIKTAATLYRTKDDKLRLKHRPRLTLWKDEFDVGSIGFVLAGTGVGLLAGAVVGALIGPSRSRQQHKVKEFLDEQLGPDDSALVILVTNADWEAVQSEVDQFGGLELAVELSAEAEKRLAEIAADESVTAIVKEYIEIEQVTL